MRKPLLIPALSLCLFAATNATHAQTPSQTPATTPAPQAGASLADQGITANLALGDVTSIDAANMTLVVKTKAGDITVICNDKTEYKQAKPGATNLKDAEPITLAGVGVGDRVIARGKVSDDHKFVPARQLIVMTKAAIAQKQEHDRAEWQRRGIVGNVTALNPDTKEITVMTRGREGQKPVIVAAGKKVQYRRYAPDSVKFDDAKASTFAELKVGDEVRALGEKSADGARLTAEEVVTGAFRMVGGTITAVNAATGEISIKNLQNGQPLTVVVNKDSMMRRIPAEMAQMLAMQAQRRAAAQAAGGGGAAGAGTNAGGTPIPPGGQGGQSPRPGGEGGGMGIGTGGGRRMGGGDFQEMFERLPAITLTELKAGDAIAVNSTTGVDPTRVTAIRLAAGIEPLLAARPATPQGQGGRGGASPNLNIPGLDGGIGLP
jgi:hypothetical protein